MRTDRWQIRVIFGKLRTHRASDRKADQCKVKTEFLLAQSSVTSTFAKVKDKDSVLNLLKLILYHQIVNMC